jgi:hypothetical protein
MAKHWPVIEQVYHRSSLTIADSQHGMLWKPLEKLMTQARAHKRDMLGSASPNEAAIRHVPLHVMPPPPLQSVPEEMPAPPAASYPLGLEPSMATGQLDSVASMPPYVILEPWPNVWDSMDLSGTGLQGSGDNLAWTNYENFIGDVYDSVDTMFLSR